MLLLLMGCGTPCDETCDKIFGDEPDQCEIQVPGRESSEMLELCVGSCSDAWRQPGEVGDYDPYERGPDEVSLENRAQVELWAECIAETACDDINDNYCAPTTNF